ncbi:MAG: RNA polymerase subunit sigma-24 [Bacteroidetes bacterium]|nr:MAG: RNA polymerase subunit sigma-24 [Bacteroidota bacterium]MBL1145895.1 sigma-70 family RNA polymerase sigma factor [Bacteroidota bacterium]MCB0801917.1 sigma-70 family RNA polymerase sigma factor [Flavobacteriales bacterium]NOG58689.1 sigma-70 family RNA polymerase sigma factor [Bacteroidota bacterium]
METNLISDSALIRQYVDGNEASFEILLKRYKNRVFSYIMFTVRDKELANDVFQETFMKVIRTLKKGKYNDEGKFLPWVNRIAHNLIIDHFRKNQKMPTTSGGDNFDIFDIIEDKSANVEEDTIKDQLLSDVKKLVYKLPQDQKEVLMMRMYFDMSFKEIAERTNVSINTALGRMRYALINLRKMIDSKKSTIVN